MITNKSGIQPLEYNVLVKQSATDTKTAGGLVLPEEVQERNKHSETQGVIVAVSPMAFSFDEWPAGAPKPKEGDRIVFARHAGTFVEGLDGEEYRVVKDKDVVATVAA